MHFSVKGPELWSKVPSLGSLHFLSTWSIRERGQGHSRSQQLPAAHPLPPGLCLDPFCSVHPALRLRTNEHILGTRHFPVVCDLSRSSQPWEVCSRAPSHGSIR